MYKQVMLSKLVNEPREITVYNLTPHEVNLWISETGDYQLEIPSDGNLRAETVEGPLPGPNDGRPLFPWGLVHTVEYRPPVLSGSLANALKHGDALIVSTLTADAWASCNWSGLPAGVQVYVPDSGPTARRDAAGRITSCAYLIAKRWIDSADWVAYCNDGAPFEMRGA